MKRFISRFLSLAFGKRIALTNDPVVGEATTTSALSSKPRASRMIFKGIMCCALISSLVGCKSIEVVSSSEVQDVQKLWSVDTVVIRDSIYIREVMRGDTVYLTRTEWRDRWRTQLVHDTVHHTEFVEKIIEKPPEKYVPKFYKWCTGLFLAIIAGVILYYVLKIVIRYYLRK